MLKTQLDELRAVLADRYAIERELGSGGMGTVYEVVDLVHGGRIALKTLQWTDAAAIYRFKREFRLLADVAHPNLVELHELVAQEDLWFFTMELVRGTSFVPYVRPGYARGTPVAGPTESHELPGRNAVADRPPAPGDGSAGVLDLERLRAALGQLAQGVAALHAAGVVHRDIKPSNVLVTDHGRVVILDFGIASGTGDLQRTADHLFSGTVGYMSPEQCSGEPPHPASDWYSVGALAYESLTGRLPFAGAGLAPIMERMVADPPRPDALVPGLPPDLVDLCVALMAREPQARPTDDDVLRRLGLASRAIVGAPAPPDEGARLVGRSSHLAALEAAFVTAASGRAVSVCVHGPSGIGKTAAVRHFTDGLVRRERATVLAGRCVVRESVPYKALDGVIDMLSRVLRAPPGDLVAASLPADTTALARVFPVLRRVEAIERRAADGLEISDTRELRRRAFAALREVLVALARERPVVIHIDDLQWADHDSADILDDVLLRPMPVPLLVVLSFRSEDVAGVPFLAGLLTRATDPDRRALAVGPLAPGEAEEYARRMLGTRHGAGEQARTLAQESAGNPFLLDMMTRVAMETVWGEDAPQGPGGMLAARLAQMPEGARELVEVLAVAGQPTDAAVAYRAADLTGDERHLVTSLSLAHLVRASATTARIDLYHDRIREIVVRELPEARATVIHRRLVEEMEARSLESPETMYEHCLGAGERRRAAGFAARAAKEAQRALAFERAALFYQRALDLRSEPGPETGAWLVGLGDALASAGRSGEAARAYLAAKPRLDEGEALEIERRAGQQLLISGRLHEGLEVVARVLQRVGLPPLASSPRRALLALIRRRISLMVRGLRFQERGERAIPADTLTRIDTCWAVAEGMALGDNIQGAAFQTLHLLLALDAGEPVRIARALALEAGFVASTSAPEKGARLLREAEALALRLGSRPTLGLCRMVGASAAVHGGRFEEGERLAVEAESILTEHQGLSAWPLSIARVYHISALVHEGKIVELCRVSRQCLDDALARGNIFAATMYRTGWSALMWLGRGDLAGARAALAESLAQTPTGVFYIPHYHCLLAQGLIDLYAGSGTEAFRNISAMWPLLERSMVMRIRSVQVLCRRMYASCAIAAAMEARDPGPLLRIAEREAGRMEREKLYTPVLIRAWAQVIRGGVARVYGDRARAMACLDAASETFAACRAAFYLAVARRLKGELLGGDAGRALIAEADTWLAAEEIVEPARLSRTFAPGYVPVDPL